MVTQTLTEHQIRRYSRQLLLKPVGGRGQVKLLATGVHVEGPADAMDVALAYLAAGGTPLDAPGPRGGFFAGGQVDSINADASSPARSLIYLCIDVDEVSLARCRDCASTELIRTGSNAAQGERNGDGVILGTFAALCAQRAALELDPLPVRWRLESDGSFSRLPARMCKSHAT